MSVPVMEPIVDRRTLENAIGAVVNRADLTPQLPAFVNLGEARLLREAEIGRGFENNPEYREPVAPLSTDPNDQNWLLLTHPDAYLYGALIHTAPYLQEDERITVWNELYKTSIAVIARESRRLGNGVPPQITHDHPTNEASRTPTAVLIEETDDADNL